jgi:thioredoxin 1
MTCSYLIQHTVGQVIQKVLIEEDIKMTSEPIHITDEAFEKVVLQSTLPVIVDFWAPWCGPCKMVAPILDKLAKEFEGKLIVAKINTDEHAEWMQKFGIQGIPTMLFVSGGKVVHRQVGALPERMLRDVVAQFMDVISQN